MHAWVKVYSLVSPTNYIKPIIWISPGLAKVYDMASVGMHDESESCADSLIVGRCEDAV